MTHRPGWGLGRRRRLTRRARQRQDGHALTAAARALLACATVALVATSAVHGPKLVKADEASPPPLRVALHAQGLSEPGGVVIGSEMTCRGLARAFEATTIAVRNGNGSQSRAPAIVAEAHVFAPYSYDRLADGRWDVLLIEGFFFQIHAVIHEFRARNPGIIVLFYTLDPALPGEAALAALDVDALLTNSGAVARRMHDVYGIPTLYVPLAADVSSDAVQPAAVRKGRSDVANGDGAGGGSDADGPGPRAVAPPVPVRHSVVYVGGDPMGNKPLLYDMLREAIPFGLVIYGQLWGDNPEFRPYWRGHVPAGSLHDVYASSVVALGATLADQAEAGMVNNRVFEVLSAGCVLVSDHFAELESAVGDTVLYVRGPGDTTRHLEAVFRASEPRGASDGHAAAWVRRSPVGPGKQQLGSVSEARANDPRVGDLMPPLVRPRGAWEFGKRGMQLVRDRHSYASRVIDILAFVDRVRSQRDASLGAGNVNASDIAEPRDAAAAAAAAAETAPRWLPPKPVRRSPLRVGVVFDGAMSGPDSVAFGLTFWPALRQLRNVYEFVPVDTRDEAQVLSVLGVASVGAAGGAEGLPLDDVDALGRGVTRVMGTFSAPDPQRCSGLDVVWALDSPGGPTDTLLTRARQRAAARASSSWSSSSTGASAGRDIRHSLAACSRAALVLVSDVGTSPHAAEAPVDNANALLRYDAVYFSTPSPPPWLQHRSAVHAFGFDPEDADAAICDPTTVVVPPYSEQVPGGYLDADLTELHGDPPPPWSRDRGGALEDVREIFEPVNEATGKRRRSSGMTLVYIGEFSYAARAGWVTRFPGARIAVSTVSLSGMVPSNEAVMVASDLRLRGVGVVTGGLTARDVVPLLCSSHALYVPSTAAAAASSATGTDTGSASATHDGSPPRAATAMALALAAMRMGTRVQTEADAYDVVALADHAPSLSRQRYAGQLSLGVGFAMTMGRGSSGIALMSPQSGARVAPNAPIELQVAVKDFDVGADGQWCFCVRQHGGDSASSATGGGGAWASGDGVLTQACILQPVFRVFVNFTFGDATVGVAEAGVLAQQPRSVEVALALKSNVYSNRVTEALPVVLVVDDGASRPATTLPAPVPREILVWQVNLP